MSYWSHNPELYDEIIITEARARGIIKEDDDREDYEIIKELFKRSDFSQIASVAEGDYWGSKIDEAMMRLKNEMPNL